MRFYVLAVAITLVTVVAQTTTIPIFEVDPIDVYS